MCGITKIRYLSYSKHELDILGDSKQHNKSMYFYIMCWLHYILMFCNIKCRLHKDKSKKEINKKDAKQSIQSTQILNEDREKNARDDFIVPDAPKTIIVADVTEVSHRLSTGVDEDGDSVSASAESDQSLFVDVSTLTTAPTLSMGSLHNFTDNTISNFEEEDFSEIITDSARNHGINLQEVKNTDISWEADDCTTSNTSLDVSEFEEDNFEGISTTNSTWNEEVNLQDVRNTKRSTGCTKPLEETDDQITSNMVYDETRLVVDTNYYVLKGSDNQDNYSGDVCRGEIKVEGKLFETELDSGLGDSMKTIDIDCSSATVFRSNELDGNGASNIVLANASVKCEKETLSNDDKHIATRQEHRIMILPRNKYLHPWTYLNFPLCRNLNNESKWRIYRRRSFTSNDPSLDGGCDHLVQQSIYDDNSPPLCELLLKVRRADDSDGNTSNCNRRNPSASTVKVFDILGNKGKEKAVPIILHTWQNGSAIRLISPVEYIVLPVSLNSYFNRVTTGTLTREEIMAYEWIRYESFHSFPPSTDMSATRLANAGFYSTDSGTQTKCFCCKVTYDRWSRGDDPYEVHRRISPNCPFLRGEAHDPQNVPINQHDEQNTSHVNENSRQSMQAQNTPSMERTNLQSARISSASARYSAVKNGQESLKTSGPILRSSTRTKIKDTSDRNHLAIQPNTAGRQYSGNSHSTQNGAAIPVHSDDNAITQSTRPEAQELPASTLEDAPLSIAQQPTEDTYNTEYSNPGNFSFRPPRDSRKGDVPSDRSPIPSRGSPGTTDYPKHSDYRMLEVRTNSFTRWPLHLDQTPQQMAEAGFFHIGVQDYVRCFQCGGGLRNWEPGDNPWVEHARWYPQCAYVRGKKGQLFVDAVTKKQQELLAQQASQNIIDTSPSKSASPSQSASSCSRASRDSASLNLSFPGKQASVNENANQNKAAVSRHSQRSRPVVRNVDASLSGPASLAYPVPGNTRGHLNGRTSENASQRETFNVPEMSSLPPFDSQSIREEYARLRSISVCKVCQQREAVIAFLPCGHLVTCENCTPTQTVCCVCQKKILASFKTYR